MTNRILSAVKTKAFTLNTKRNTFVTKLPKRNCHPRDSAKMSEVLEIDGGMMEGGGQILRMSMALSALLKKPIRIYNIRAGRSSPGLRPQHLAGVKLVGEITRGRLTGAAVGSTEVTFHPGPITGGKYEANPGTAGSVMLLFQVSFPCLLFADRPSELYLQGGTNADMAPQIDHTLMVFKPIVERLGANFSCEILKRGYFPKGGGKVVMQVEPVASHLQSIELLSPGSVTEIEGRSFVSGVLPIKMAHSMADAASQCLKKKFPGIPVDINRLKEPAHLAVGNGVGIVLVAKTDTGCLLGGSGLKNKRDGTTEDVGETAAKEITDEADKKACVDTYVQDQIIIFMALAKGKSRVRIGSPTLHTKTAIFVAEMMTKAKFTLCPDETGESTVIECDGIGLERR